MHVYCSELCLHHGLISASDGMTYMSNKTAEAKRILKKEHPMGEEGGNCFVIMAVEVPVNLGT